MIRVLVLSAFICLGSGLAFAQTSASVVNARPVLSVDKVKPGSRFQGAGVVDISSGSPRHSNRPSRGGKEVQFLRQAAFGV